jgi:hypothetical protein
MMFFFVKKRSLVLRCKRLVVWSECEESVCLKTIFLDPWEALNRVLSNKITTQLAESTWIPHDLVIDLCHIPFHHPAASFAHKSV